MKKTAYILAGLCLAAGLISTAYSTLTDPVKPYTFKSGSVAKSSEVNADFDTVYAAVATSNAAINDLVSGDTKAGDAAKLNGVAEATGNEASTIVKRNTFGNFSSHHITADHFSGAFIGNITGNVTGNVTGSLTGSASQLNGQAGTYYQPASTAITTGNIASQSVANADTVDTVHAATFVRALNNASVRVVYSVVTVPGSSSYTENLGATVLGAAATLYGTGGVAEDVSLTWSGTNLTFYKSAAGNVQVSFIAVISQ